MKTNPHVWNTSLWEGFCPFSHTENAFHTINAFNTPSFLSIHRQCREKMIEREREIGNTSSMLKITKACRWISHSKKHQECTKLHSSDISGCRVTPNADVTQQKQLKSVTEILLILIGNLVEDTWTWNGRENKWKKNKRGDIWKGHYVLMNDICSVLLGGFETLTVKMLTSA